MSNKADQGLAQRLTELARERQRFGYRRLTALLRRESRNINHKGFTGSIGSSDWPCEGANGDTVGSAFRRPQKHACKEQTSVGPWTLGPIHWRRAAFCILTIIDEYTRECLAIETDTGLPGLRVIRVLEFLAQTRGLPDESSVDHASEFVCRSVRSWWESTKSYCAISSPATQVPQAEATISETSQLERDREAIQEQTAG